MSEWKSPHKFTTQQSQVSGEVIIDGNNCINIQTMLKLLGTCKNKQWKNLTWTLGKNVTETGKSTTNN